MKEQGRVLTFTKYIVVLVSTWLLITLFVKISNNLLSKELFVIGVVAFFVGYLLADLLTGTVHWFCDTFFSENAPFIGPIIIASFREHHTHPQLFTKDKFIEQDTTSFFVLLIPLFIAVSNESSYSNDLNSFFWHSTLIGLSIGAFGTNLFHKWAHQTNPPLLAKKLQKMGLILTPDRHNKHHRDYRKSFCVTSGWLNFLLDHTKFFLTLERFIRLFSYKSYEPRT